jgi:hypothetical protein
MAMTVASRRMSGSVAPAALDCTNKARSSAAKGIHN